MRFFEACLCAAVVQQASGLSTLVRPGGVQLRGVAIARGAVAARSPAPEASAVSALFRPLAGPIAALVARPRALTAVVAALVTGIFLWLVRVLNTPSRSYEDGERESGGINSVGKEYDAWTSEGILEYYWGEHIHLGYYEEGQRKGPFYGGKGFIDAKYDFIDQMLKFSKADSPTKVLDVGCGIGGTSRYLAKAFPAATVTGITISPGQQKRATELATERKIGNVDFQLVDALNMTFADNTYDLVGYAFCSAGRLPTPKFQMATPSPRSVFVYR